MTEPAMTSQDVPAGVPMPDGTEPPGTVKDRRSSLWADAWRDLRRNPVFIISGLVVLIVSSMAVFRGLWTSQDPYAQGFYDITTAQDSPGDGHPFGVSVQGGDLYAQIIYGARPSITIAVFTTIGVTALGMLVGTLAGYYGGKVDAVLSRITDFVLGLPFLLGAIIFLSVFANRTVWVLIIVLTALGWTEMTRVMRGSVIQTKSYDFVEAARALGAKNRLIIWRHIVPNSITPVIVLATLAVGGIVSAEATLTFLGIGLPPGTVSWGGLISEAQTPAMNGNPHLLIFPCAFLVVTVLSFILLGDALRDALDPKIR